MEEVQREGNTPRKPKKVEENLLTSQQVIEEK